MNYDEYARDGRILYESFAQTVAFIIEAAIADSDQDFRMQQISFRAKSDTSLIRKLTERELLEASTIEAELKDLAGCRVIFYTNQDIDRFLSARLIFENFKVDFDGSKIHHAVGTERAAEDLYFAIHYVVSLTDQRLELPEYRNFGDCVAKFNCKRSSTMRGPRPHMTFSTIAPAWNALAPSSMRPSSSV